MSGYRWISLLLLIAFALSAAGCQVDGGKASLWNPFVRADKTEESVDEPLPKFVRRLSNDDKDKAERPETPIAESRVEALLAEGQRALQENRIADAQRTYGEVLQFLPDNSTAHHGLAMAADLTEQWADAENHYRQALRSRPRDANLLCDIGYSYLLQNRYSEASSYLSQAIQINPNHENAHTNLAMLDLRQGNRDAARDRILQRFGNTAKATQVLAALDSQIGAKAASSLATTAPEIPANASFDEVRELARRERIAAEQRRSGLTVPVGFSQEAQLPNRISAANASPGTLSPAIHQPEHPGAQFSGSITAPAWNAQAPASAANFAQQAGPLGAPVSGNNGPGYFPTQPSGQNLNPGYAYGNEAIGTYNAKPLPESTLQSAPGTIPGLATTNPPAASANYMSASSTANVPGSGGLIAVRSSGTFQPPAQGVSYGQPMGFGQPPLDTANYQNQNFGPSAGTTGYGPTPGSQQPNWPAHQNPGAGQNLSNLQLEGLNAGPGALFPIGQYPNSQAGGLQAAQQGTTNAAYAPNPSASGQFSNGPPPLSGVPVNVGPQDGTLRMGNVMAPGTNSVINGAMYGQPVSTLPSQEWMMQQQQQQQQIQQFQQQPNHAGQGYSYPAANSSSTQGSPPNNTNFTSAPRPNVQNPPVDPLASYKNQLQQVDNQYNSALQQMDRNAPANAPRAQ